MPRYLDIQLIDSAHLTSRDDLVTGVLDSRFEEYLYKSYIGSEVDKRATTTRSREALVHELGDEHSVFLQRSVRSSADYREDDDDNDIAILSRKNIIVHNGLELKINCASSKRSFVLETEDVFCRMKFGPMAEDMPKPVPAEEHMYQNAKRQNRFRCWLDERWEGEDLDIDPFLIGKESSSC